jgi:hypothetical protein
MDGNIRSDDVKQLKQELTDLLQEDTKADKLRSLPCIAAKLLVGKLYVQSVMIRCKRYYKRIHH